MDGESLDELNRRRDARNRENVALAGLGIRTLADIFEAAERRFGAGKSGHPDVGGYFGGDLKRVRIGEGEEELSLVAASEAEGVWQRREGAKEPRGQTGKQRGSRRRKQGAVSRAAVGGLSGGAGQRGGSAESVEYGDARGTRFPSIGGNAGGWAQVSGPPKRKRAAVRRERDEEEQAGDLASVLGALDEEFAEKERLSYGQEWCALVPYERKVKTA
ncbi:hypothetical protein ACJZ2D_014651 [Fusarium nematophilum]